MPIDTADLALSVSNYNERVAKSQEERLKRMETAFDRLCGSLKRGASNPVEIELIRQYAAGMLDSR